MGDQNPLIATRHLASVPDLPYGCAVDPVQLPRDSACCRATGPTTHGQPRRRQRRRERDRPREGVHSALSSTTLACRLRHSICHSSPQLAGGRNGQRGLGGGRPQCNPSRCQCPAACCGVVYSHEGWKIKDTRPSSFSRTACGREPLIAWVSVTAWQDLVLCKSAEMPRFSRIRDYTTTQSEEQAINPSTMRQDPNRELPAEAQLASSTKCILS
jgi:hypothetical protein